LRAVWFDRHSRFPALARYLSREIGALSAGVPPVLLAVRDRLRGPGLARHQAAGRHLRDPGAHPHLLLFRILPDRVAAARHLRENKTAAKFDFGIGSGRQGVRMAKKMNMQRTIFALALAGSLVAIAAPASAEDQV